jgi:hypothetical protein
MVLMKTMQTGTLNNKVIRTRRKPATWVQKLPAGPAGILVTLRLMADWCLRDRTNQSLRDFAHNSLFRSIPGHAFDEEVKALFEFVRDKITYRKDPVGVERVQDAARTLEIKTGDCDDKVTLLVSLLLVCGYRARFAVCGRKQGRWSHVYCEVFRSDGWISLDPTNEFAEVGWELDVPHKAIYTLMPHTGKLNVVRQPKPVSLQRPQPASGRHKTVRLIHAARPASLGDVFCYDDDGLLGADKYEWKLNKQTGQYEYVKKKGFWGKVGGALKKVGKVALQVAPIAAAPFTGGGSLALKAGTLGAKIASGVATGAGAINQALANRGAGAEYAAIPQGYAPQEQPQAQASFNAAASSEGLAASFTSSPVLMIGAAAVVGVLLLSRR